MIAEGSRADAPEIWHELPREHVWSAWRSRHWPTTQRTQLWYRGERHGVPVSATFTLRWVYQFEMIHLLSRAGFEVQEVFGDFERSPLVDDSPRMLFIAGKQKA
jgi:hypothetical protein